MLFYIAKRSSASTFFDFRFIIVLHVDDKKVLDFIQSILGIVRTSKDRATFIVNTQ